MDSFSQAGPNINDDVQQEHWIEETAKLWTEATGMNETFDFLTIDDVLEENRVCKEDNKRLHDIIDDNITTLFDGLNALSTNVSTVSSRVDEVAFKVTDNRNAIELNTASIDEIISDGEF